tara:strand:+ start:172 stop:399 length:228 start_codon:yes stop_codon:yes gene_type:complete
LLFNFDTLADYGAFVEELPWNEIVHNMQAGRQTRSLHPMPIDWNLSNEVAPADANLAWKSRRRFLEITNKASKHL